MGLKFKSKKTRQAPVAQAPVARAEREAAVTRSVTAGSRKPKKPTRKEKSASSSLERLTAGSSCRFSNAVVDETRKLLEEYMISPAMVGSPSSIWDTLARGSFTLKYIRASHEQYLRALIAAYGVYVVAMKAEKKKELIKALCEQVGVMASQKTDVIALICRCLIKYGDDAEHKKNRQYWSRDANAIRYLEAQGIPPGHVLAFQKEKGAGIDLWARLWTERHGKIANRKSETAAEPETEEAQKIGRSIPELEKELSEKCTGNFAYAVIIRRAGGTLRAIEQVPIGAIYLTGSKRLAKVLRALAHYAPKN